MNIAVLSLHIHPILVLFGSNGVETDSHAQGGSLEKQFLHNEPRVLFFRLAQNAQRKSIVNICLANIQNGSIIFRQNFRHGSCQSRTVFTRNTY